MQRMTTVLACVVCLAGGFAWAEDVSAKSPPLAVDKIVPAPAATNVDAATVAGIRATLKGMITAVETNDFKTYFNEYNDPELLKQKFKPGEIEEMKLPPEKKQQLLAWLRLALTLEPKVDEATGLYMFKDDRLRGDLVFKRIDGKFRVTRTDREPGVGR